VGTCQQQSEENKIGRYLPMASMLSLFADLPVSGRMLNLESELESKYKTQSRFPQKTGENRWPPLPLNDGSGIWCVFKRQKQAAGSGDVESR